MRVAVVSEGGVHAHAPSRALIRQLQAAGNEVEVREHLSGGRRRRLRDLVGDGPRIVHPANRGDLAAAVDVAGDRGLVAAPVAWGLGPDHDVAWRAPGDPTLSTAPAGPGLAHHVAPAVSAGPPTTPVPGRHRGRSLVVVARWTAATPARYLADAAEDAGVTVHRRDALDWDEVAGHDGVDGVLVVESPLPALPVRGARREVPVLLWAHHGEHHTDTHMRLVRHYGADAVLLAHSWHLAHRYPRPVHRFPFGLPSSLVSGGLPFDERPFGAAFVGSGLDGGGAYQRRGELLASLTEALGADRVAFESGQPPQRIPELYGRASLVPNDCGTRHRPITMRVFEAVGAGAVLLTDDAPGLDRLVDPEAHHVLIQDPVGPQAAALLEQGTLAERAAAALVHARGHHSTDHRVDELFDVLDATTPALPLPAAPVVNNPLLHPVADDLLLDDVLPLGVDAVEEQLPDRVVWEQSRIERLAGRPLAHAVVVGADWRGGPDRAVAAARRLVVAHRSRGEVVEAALASSPAARLRCDEGDVVAVDLGTAGYRVDGP